jgi:hypothetical protein
MTKVESEGDEERRVQVNKRAARSLNQLLNVISYVQPDKKGQIIGLKKASGALLREIIAANGSIRYEELVERVCDDLMENVDNQIDQIKRGKHVNPETGGGGQAQQMMGAGASTLRSEHFT